MSTENIQFLYTKCSYNTITNVVINEQLRYKSLIFERIYYSSMTVLVIRCDFSLVVEKYSQDATCIQIIPLHILALSSWCYKN